MNPIPPARLLNLGEAATVIGVSRPTLAKIMTGENPPPFFRLNRALVITYGALRDWIDERQRAAIARQKAA